jgi:MFS transporter, YNFM family, putative membrane transport protein
VPGGRVNVLRPVALLGAAAFCVAANMRIAEPLIPRIAQEFSVSAGAASVIATAFALSYGICQLIYGPLGDRYGKFRLVAIAMTLSALAVFGAALAQSLTALALLRLASGATAAAVITLGLAYVGDIAPYKERQATLAHILTGQLIGVVFGQAAGGMIIEFAGWRVAFMVVGSAFALVAVSLWIELRFAHVNRARTSDPLNPRRLFRQYLALAASPRSRLILLAIFAEGFLFFGALAYFGAFLRSTFAIDYFKIGLVLGCFGLGGLSYSLFARLFVSKFGEHGMMRLGGVLLGIGLCGLPLLPVWTAAIPLIFAIGFGLFMAHNTLQTKATQMDLEARGSAVSLFTFCFFVGQAAGVATLGIGVDQFGYGVIFTIAGVGLFSLFQLYSRTLRAA